MPEAITMDGRTTTTYKVVIPFYLYAALAFLAASILLWLSASGISTHYFQPNTLAITHIMALGWGTMIILGAAHQLVPVLIEAKLYSNHLAYATFVLAAVGIPLLSYGFYVFNMGWPAKWGGRLIMLSIIAFLINLWVSMAKSRRENVHAVFVLTATIWLLATATVGLVLVYNFTYPFLKADSLAFLPLHAHTGIVGWFLLLITGVGSRLIPMFLISKYTNARKLWMIYGLINGGLLSFIFIFLYAGNLSLLIFPLLAILSAMALFGHYCYQVYRQRIRKKVDEPMRVSLLSVVMMLLPVLFIVLIIILLMITSSGHLQLAVAYGFVIFFGWITAIILGMTFKTLPFIVWNKVYHQLAGKGKTPDPKALFSHQLFRWMGICYILGFLVFTAGIFLGYPIVLQTGAAFLTGTSLLYNLNVIKLIMHKPRSI